MTDTTLVRVREAAAAYASAVRETQQFFEELDAAGVTVASIDATRD